MTQKITFPLVALRPPKLPNSLSKLSRQLDQVLPKVDQLNSLFPLREVSSLVKEWLRGEGELSALNLLRLINARPSELNLQAHERTALARQLWMMALKAPERYSALISLVANQRLMSQATDSAEDQWLTDALLSFNDHEIHTCPQPQVRELLSVLRSSEAPLRVMRRSYQAHITPWRWLAARFVSLQPEAMSMIIPYTVAALEPLITLSAQDASWLRDCLVHAQDNQVLKVRLAQELLLALPKRLDHQVGLKPLVRWFQTHFQRGSYEWRSLKPEAQNRLIIWLGELTYLDFAQLITKVHQLLKGGRLDPALLSNPKRMTSELNRLERRRDFWDAYKKSFSRMRVLFPQSTLTQLRGEATELLNVCEVETLGSGEQVEVCLFELKHLVIAEVFRGDVTEIFVFEMNDLTSELLFNQPLGLNVLRADDRLRRLKIFDHLYLWQGEVQRWLFSQGVPTDPEVKVIKNLPPSTRFVNGLTPRPKERDQRDRESKIARWETKRQQQVIEARVALSVTQYSG